MLKGGHMKTKFWKARLTYFLFGIIVVIAVAMLMGAYGNSYGRYQIDAWGGSGIGFGAFVVDTATGETKLVYLNTGMQTDQRNNLGMRFDNY
jgi:hypothetical protein